MIRGFITALRALAEAVVLLMFLATIIAAGGMFSLAYGAETPPGYSGAAALPGSLGTVAFLPVGAGFVDCPRLNFPRPSGRGLLGG